ncbi:hypothetical protein JMUB7529_28330 [Staphylococcus aureus]
MSRGLGDVYKRQGVNCTGSCSWKVFVKNGVITWENQQTDYPSCGPDMPEYEPRGCPRCLLYTSPSPRDMRRSRMPSSA